METRAVICGCVNAFRSRPDLASPQGSKLDVASMVLQADVPTQRLLPQLLPCLLIEIDDQLAVESDLDPRAGALDVDAVPLSRGQDRILARGDVTVERPA